MARCPSSLISPHFKGSRFPPFPWFLFLLNVHLSIPIFSLLNSVRFFCFPHFFSFISFCPLSCFPSIINLRHGIRRLSSGEGSPQQCSTMHPPHTHTLHPIPLPLSFLWVADVNSRKACRSAAASLVSLRGH